MTSMFDTPEFTERLFFPRADDSPAPHGAVDLEVPGDATLHVRWHRSGDAAATLLLFHGNGEVVADYDASAADFAGAGLDLAVMDFRGYGRSTGEPTLRNTIGDAHRVLRFMIDRVAGGRLFVMGRSLGSACAAELYAGSPAEVRGFILESGSADLDALTRRRGLEPRPLTSDERAVFDPLPKLARGTAPLLVLHGAHDTLIDASEARRAHAAAGTEDKQLVLIPGRGHNDVSRSPLYWEAIAAFVGQR